MRLQKGRILEHMAPEFNYSDLLPIGPDETEYRFLGKEGVEVVEAAGSTFITV